jgi:hypothetical protein
MVARSWIIPMIAALAACSSDSAGPSAMAPTFTRQPAAVTAVPGSPALFSVAATAPGGATLSYHWQRGAVTVVDGPEFGGATTANLTVNSVSASDTGTYTAVATATLNGTSASATSNAAQLTIDPPPVITLQPLRTTAALDSPTTITVAATPSAGGTLVYQWRKDGVGVPDDGIRVGTQTAQLKFWSMRPADVGVYDVVVFNQLNGVQNALTSDTARLIINLPPVINGYPTVTTFWDSVTAAIPISAQALGGATLSYEWHKGPYPIADTGRYSGTHSATLTISHSDTTDEAAYEVFVTSTLDGTKSQSRSGAIQIGIDMAPIITHQPFDHSLAVGDNLFVGVSVWTHDAVGATYQWQKNGVDLVDGGTLAGSQDADLRIFGVVPSDAGTYHVIVKTWLGSTFKSVTSSDAVVTVH